MLGVLASVGLIIKVEGKDTTYNSKDPLSIKIQKIKQEVKDLESSNIYLESEILILNHQITQIFQTKENQELIKLSKIYWDKQENRSWCCS